MRKEESYIQYVAGVINRCLSQHPKVEKEDKVLSSNLSKAETSPVIGDEKLHEPHVYDNGSDKSDNFTGWKQKLEVAWLSKALEPAMQLYKWASLAGDVFA